MAEYRATTRVDGVPRASDSGSALLLGLKSQGAHIPGNPGAEQ